MGWEAITILPWLVLDSDQYLFLQNFTIRFYSVRLVRNLCEQKGFSRQYFSDMGITKADGSQADLGASTSEKAPAGSITSAR